MMQLHTSRPSIALVLCVGLVLAGAAVASVPAAADHDEDGADDYVATQGDACVELATYGDGAGTVESFYDYRWEEPGMQFSSYGTTHLQREDVSQLFLYHGSEGVSLVMVHDELDDDADENATGGGITLEFQGLPDGEFAVMDDDYDESIGGGPDDRLAHSGSTAQADWVYVGGRTDGAAFRGVDALGADAAIDIDPRFGDASWGGQRGYNRADGEVTWQVRQDEGDELHSVADDQRLSIERGTCTGSSLDASLTASPATVDVGESVTLEATTTTDEPVDDYRWDFDGDGIVDRATSQSSVTVDYDDAGTVTPEVTVETGDETATATTEVEVNEQNHGPEAALSAPESVALGETATLDASGSTDDGSIESYRWDVGDDGSVDYETDDPTLEHATSAVGEQTVTVTVVDDSGETDSASAAFAIVDETAPTAVVDAPETAAVGETITVDGSDSSDGDAVASYNWTIDGDAASGATVTRAFEDAGSKSVTLTVADPSGNENQTTTTIEVDGDDDGDENDGDGDDGDDGDDGNGDDENDGDENDDSDDGDGDDGNDDNDGGDEDDSDENDGGDDDDSDDGGSDNTGGSPSWSVGSDEPTATLESTDDSAFEFTIEDGDPGDTVTADVDGTAVGPLQRIEVELDSDVEEWTATLEAVDDPSTETEGSARYELDPDDEGPIHSVTYLFDVERSEFDGDSEELLVVERDEDGAWTALDTTVERRRSTLEVRASSDALERVRLGSGALESEASADGAAGSDADEAFDLVELSVAEDTVEAEEAVDVTATVRNDAETEATERVELIVDGDAVAEETVTVPAGEEATVSFAHAIDEPGTYDVGVGDERRTVEVARAESENAVPGTGATAAVFAAFVLVVLALVAIERRAGS